MLAGEILSSAWNIVVLHSVVINLIKYFQMNALTKPINEYLNQKRYLLHKQKLVTIQSERPKPLSIDQHSSIQKLRHYSIAYHAQKQEQQINNENQKLLQKLLDISKRKNSIYAPSNSSIPKITSFHNPARKKRQRIITEMNQQMAQRLLTRGSQLDHKMLRRSMEQYERFKKTRVNNKKILSQSGHLGPSLPIMKKSWQSPDEEKSPVKINYEQSQQRLDE